MTEPSGLLNAAFINDLYEIWLQDPNQLEPEWQLYFSRVQVSQSSAKPERSATQLQAQFRLHPSQQADNAASAQRKRRQSPHPLIAETTTQPAMLSASLLSNALSRQQMEKQSAVHRLIHYFRVRGHEIAELDPLKLHDTRYVEDLDPAFHGLTEADMDMEFSTGTFFAFSNQQATLREIFTALQQIYCGHIGIEFMHLTDTRKKRWLQENLEARFVHDECGVDSDCKQHILERLVAAEGLEHYLHMQYVGQKRFSLEGAESLIPLLDEVVQNAGRYGVKELVFGMAHRGRLNVLVNIMGKSTRELFSEFEGTIDIDPRRGSGDVKYHQGYSTDVMTPGGPLHLTLAFNPSHLEIINPVVEGSVRARQERRHDHERNEVLPVLIHGDSAFSGQGVVMETLNLSETKGYRTGGTVHIVINNQIGFTTSDPFDVRSTLYCTDVAKMVRAPIFHVNADNPEAVIRVSKLALEYRMKFNMDVVIDMICYRRHGHNEADEPMATQPQMYQRIKKHPPITTLYAEKLIKNEIIQPQDAEMMAQQYRAVLKAQEMVEMARRRKVDGFEYGTNWKPYLGTKWTQEAPTHISKEALQYLSERITSHPPDFKLHRTVERIIENRKKMAAGEIDADWGFAELLAYASLLQAGYPVRLSGQDSGRGTFAHRHAVLHDQSHNGMYIPLQHITPRQPQFLIINSLLSEEAVLGFEFGYASSEPETLTIWEAQFGDFANGAQVVVDQFISSSEAKWRRLCGLVLFLPHGYDGQGPEHSSARLERYLQLCAENNMQVCVPSEPAQFFHLLRRQMLRPYRKPLIVMTPKSLLRNKHSTSKLEDFTDKDFELLIDETDTSIDPKQVKRVLLCAGQVYFKLLEARTKKGINNIAILRLEQLYPLPRATLSRALEKYSNTKQWFWVQEEPRNQGAWNFIHARVLDTMHQPNIRLGYAGRLLFASPAAGYLKAHLDQERELIEQAFDLEFRG
ncbi:2-oxoglutarate dehydrogenase E1 component [Candidatus Venteria ishoeyi]|uniref:2-oxoglutarate dehydrogenase E1 component n=1 Tax=Candidatus Venteria ishoeyi TaxID=1899563 RepID=A0A1H6F5U0_9GAMM|nr:2-oxoglutarate dehydrogenase E1 component [Candidatus Venteria ishoeyi]MDM8546224.1 2-oxoglutarate dehydrogenase E1 component [Candidatus Venteria ishoeyi]SEH04355.1 2-oxoglutarate dehydrogenase E1 component [Candidatus Venteria ishoeyi]